MIDDFRPLPRRDKSLQENTNTLKVEEPPTETQLSATTAPEQVTIPAPIFEPLNALLETTPRQSFKAKLVGLLALRWPPTKKEYIAGVLIILLIASGVGTMLIFNKPPKPVAATPVVAKVVKPKPVVPTTVASNLSGLQVDPAINAKPVIGVMIENSEYARPQSGLSQASVVYEAIAEGGITRFLTLFQDTNPGDIGPIRSVRPYYLQWALGFDASLAHVGGSPEALQDIKDWGAKDLDQFYNSGSYHRISARDAPHNVYTAVDTLTQLAVSKGFTSSAFTPWTRKPEAAAKLVTAKNIDLTLSGPLYNVHYAYDAASNSYQRSMAGAPHLDANGSVQISPKVVIGLVMPYAIQADGKHSEYGTTGSGAAYIFQDGTVTIGQWNKADQKASMNFTDAAGKPLPLNAGQTWLTAVTDAVKISSAP